MYLPCVLSLFCDVARCVEADHRTGSKQAKTRLQTRDVSMIAEALTMTESNSIQRVRQFHCLLSRLSVRPEAGLHVHSQVMVNTSFALRNP